MPINTNSNSTTKTLEKFFLPNLHIVPAMLYMIVDTDTQLLCWILSRKLMHRYVDFLIHIIWHLYPDYRTSCAPFRNDFGEWDENTSESMFCTWFVLWRDMSASNQNLRWCGWLLFWCRWTSLSHGKRFLAKVKACLMKVQAYCR